MHLVLILLPAFVIVGCSESEYRFWTGGETINGPNGETQKLVSCYDISTCYYMAQEACDNNGYEIMHTTYSDGSGSDTLTNVLVSCKSPYQNYSHCPLGSAQYCN